MSTLLLSTKEFISLLMMRTKYWDLVENQRNYLDRLGRELNFKSKEDWYGIRREVVAQFGGEKILARFHGSPLKMVLSIYPEHSWTIWKFKAIDPSFWKEKCNLEQYLDWLGRELEIGDMSGWYKIKKEQVLKLGGSEFLSKYRGSLRRGLEDIYPHHSWIPWKFRQVPIGYWEKAKNIQDYVRWLTNELEIKKLADWYRIALKSLEKVTQITPFRTKGIVSMLQGAYPNHNWDVDKLSSRKGIRSSQKRMVILLESIFEGTGTFFSF